MKASLRARVWMDMALRACSAEYRIEFIGVLNEEKCIVSGQGLVLQSFMKFSNATSENQELQDLWATIFFVSFDTLAELRTSRYHRSKILLEED